mmetsp:Transcript_54106/g.82000  ORF Transcript_54106/g.82000 Transcript_54106/m.82000 type:complete len:103 (-) Transcript_54106:86-394(-)
MHALICSLVHSLFHASTHPSMSSYTDTHSPPFLFSLRGSWNSFQLLAHLTSSSLFSSSLLAAAVRFQPVHAVLGFGVLCKPATPNMMTDQAALYSPSSAFVR